MKREFMPYYFSRAALSLVFSFLVVGFTWKALALAVFFFALFLLYLHSGWFQIDASKPWFPLRRDERGREIQRKALIAAVATGAAALLILTAIPVSLPLQMAAGSVALTLAMCVYFAIQFALFARS